MLIFQDVLLKRAAVRPVLLGYIYMLLKKHIKTMVHMLFQAKYSLKHRHYRLDKHAIISLLFYCGSVLCKRHLYRLEIRCLFFENIFKKLFFKLSSVYLLLEKLVKENCFSIKQKFSLIFRKMFSWKI
jgi:hypothetical protein